jgi:hypothetical protein
MEKGSATMYITDPMTMEARPTGLAMSKSQMMAAPSVVSAKAGAVLAIRAQTTSNAIDVFFMIKPP